MRLHLNTAIKFHPFRVFLLSPLRPQTLPSRTYFYPPTKTQTQRLPNTLFLASSSTTAMATSSSVDTHSPPPPPLVQVKEKIELTDVEKKIFERLLNTLRHFNLKTELRVAGGWVRDKLLGKDCYDIDIALDDMLGREFVEKVRDYLLSTGEEVHGAAVIRRNPDQSKHLETARMRLFDLWIDFVNLRCEDYCENSRIPTMKYGTAAEDAYRRDLTINSLFYNINTSSVEDFTGRGIEDLKSGKIVTPLPPKSTFLDDPLRVLRAIRFGARFGFILDEELKKAASSDDVKNVLAAKISRERVGTEIDLMISGNQPVKAMTYISDLTLFWVVFSIPPEVEPTISEGSHRLCVTHLEAAWGLVQSIGYSSFSDEERRLLLYAALFLPFRRNIYKDEKRKMNPVVNFIFKESLKQKASDAETVIKIHRSSEQFVSLIPLLTTGKLTHAGDVDCEIELDDIPITSKLRVLTGSLLQEIKDFWRVALLISTMLYPSDIDTIEDFVNEQFYLDERANLFKAVESAVVELGLDKVWNMKPLVNGKEIMNVLQLKSAGPVIREWQQKLRAWQLAHPSGTADECIDWMRETYAKRAKMG